MERKNTTDAVISLVAYLQELEENNKLNESESESVSFSEQGESHHQQCHTSQHKRSVSHTPLCYH